MGEGKGTIKFRNLVEEHGRGQSAGAQAWNRACDLESSSNRDANARAHSPEIQRDQRATPLRIRAQLQHVWNSSPLNPATLGQRIDKIPDQKQVVPLSQLQPPSRQPESPGRRSLSLDGLGALNRRELVWGPHADFELRERVNSFRGPSTPTFPSNANGDDVVQRRISEYRNRSTRESEQLPREQGPKTPPPRTPPYTSRGLKQNSTKKEELKNPARTLTRAQLMRQRISFFLVVFCFNAACLIAALESHRRLWVLILILFLRSKDVLSTLGVLAWIALTSLRRPLRRPAEVSSKWILACVTAYAETEIQIMRTINSIIQHHPDPHKIVLCIILDGKPANIRSYFTRSSKRFRSSYQTWKFTHGELNINTGFMEQVPVILFEKVRNAGKKDSLILCHDLFDAMRDNAPLSTQVLRREIWTEVMPSLLDEDVPSKFDYIFCTDADSLIHKDALQRLVLALSANPKAIAACGLVLAEMEKGNEWSIWYLFQQFQVSRRNLLSCHHLNVTTSCFRGQDAKLFLIVHVRPIRKTPRRGTLGSSVRVSLRVLSDKTNDLQDLLTRMHNNDQCTR